MYVTIHLSSCLYFLSKQTPSRLDYGKTTTLNAKKDKGIVSMTVNVKKALNAELKIVVSISLLGGITAVTNLKNPACT